MPMLDWILMPLLAFAMLFALAIAFKLTWEAMSRREPPGGK